MGRIENAIGGNRMTLAATLALAVILALSSLLVGRVLAHDSIDRSDAAGSNFGYFNTLGSERIFERSSNSGALGKVTLQVTGGATVTVPLTTNITVSASGGAVTVPVDVLNTPGGDLGAYQFDLNFDPAVINVTGILGGSAPFDAITASNLTSPVTGGGVVRWNHFQGGQVPVPAAINVSNVEVEAVGSPGECSVFDITVVELVDNDGVPIPNSHIDGQVCLLDVDAQAETDLVAAEDSDDPPGALSTGVKPTINLITDVAGVPLPAREISGYEANITFPASLAEATDCRLKPPFTGGPSDCFIDPSPGVGLVHLQATAGVTGSGVVAPIDPLAFVPLRLVGSNDPVAGLTTVESTFIIIVDSLGNPIPQVGPPDSRTFLRGDALADGGVSIGDALFIGQHLVAPLLRPVGEGVGEVHPVNAGSVNHDTPGTDFISLADAVLIAQFLVGNVDDSYNP